MKALMKPDGRNNVRVNTILKVSQHGRHTPLSLSYAARKLSDPPCPSLVWKCKLRRHVAAFLFN